MFSPPEDSQVSNHCLLIRAVTALAHANRRQPRFFNLRCLPGGRIRYHARVRRWAFHIFCCLSLLVFAGSVALWVRSYFVGESIVHWDVRLDSGGKTTVWRCAAFGLGSARGTVGLERVRIDSASTVPQVRGWVYKHGTPYHDLVEPDYTDDRFNVHVGGFQFRHAAASYSDAWRTRWCLVLPFWIFLPTAFPTILWWRRYRRKNKRGFPVEATSPAPIS
jgi:hypothetical protein